MIGIDGQQYGRMGRDANGNMVFKTGADLARENMQRKADEARIETLYVAEDYKVFFVTKQPAATAVDGRNAYISVKPFNGLPPDVIDQMKEKATPWDASSSAIRIEAKDPLLLFYDDITKTQSSIYIGELDADVRQRLRFNTAVDAAESAWEKYVNVPAASAAGSTFATKDDVSIRRPLTLKKPAFQL